ncbi:aminoglycoside phosphotransferase family protein [Paenibacillus alvei]|uniref:Predicted kinase, aminoglycoside phosphotransferase (APT) family n=1 Tax=Paenibacillus alvei TaxID=44250 RepID=A0A383R9Q8_PAEAL
MGVRIKNDSILLSFIEDNLQLMRHRPNLFQHDDFHVGNLIIKDNQLSGVIDFNRFDWGDPIHEFLKVGMFSSELYTLYLSMCLISSIVWISKVNQKKRI